jgi:hypothetical protein
LVPFEVDTGAGAGGLKDEWSNADSGAEAEINSGYLR